VARCDTAGILTLYQLCRHLAFSTSSEPKFQYCLLDKQLSFFCLPVATSSLALLLHVEELLLLLCSVTEQNYLYILLSFYSLSQFTICSTWTNESDLASCSIFFKSSLLLPHSLILLSHLFHSPSSYFISTYNCCSDIHTVLLAMMRTEMASCLIFLSVLFNNC
jgi:hypothetical protein